MLLTPEWTNSPHAFQILYIAYIILCRVLVNNKEIACRSGGYLPIGWGVRCCRLQARTESDVTEKENSSKCELFFFYKKKITFFVSYWIKRNGERNRAKTNETFRTFLCLKFKSLELILLVAFRFHATGNLVPCYILTKYRFYCCYWAFITFVALDIYVWRQVWISLSPEFVLEKFISGISTSDQILTKRPWLTTHVRCAYLCFFVVLICFFLYSSLLHGGEFNT